MFKRILLSLSIISLVGSSAIAGTQALLSDTSTLTANSFSVGTVDLQIAKDSDSTWANDVTGFTKSNMHPGDTIDNFFWLQNISDVKLNITGQAITLGGSIDTSKVILKIIAVDGSGNETGTAVTGSLANWASGPSGISPELTAGSTQRYKLTVTLDSSITTGGSSTSFDLQFVGTQVLPSI